MCFTTRQYQYFHLKITVGIDVIQTSSGIAEQWTLRQASTQTPGPVQLDSRLLKGNSFTAPLPLNHALPSRQTVLQEPDVDAHADRKHRPPATPSVLVLQRIGSITTLKHDQPSTEIVGALEIEQGFRQRLELLEG